VAGIDYTLWIVLWGTALIGVASGVLGSFALLRRQSLLGDAVSHCALAGITAAFLIVQQKSPVVILGGAAVSGWLGAVLVDAMTRHTRLTTDTGLALVLSVFFGLGLVLLTQIQKLPIASQAGLDRFLFGQAATMLERDVFAIAVLGGVALIGVALLWKEWKLLILDPEFAAANGFSVRLLETLLSFILVIAIVIGLQSVGVVLMSALVVAPAAAARQWTDRFFVFVALAAVFGGASAATGTWMASLEMRLPTGPVIVLVAGGWVVVSLLIGRTRGILWRRLTLRRRRAAWLDGVLLRAFLQLAEQHGTVTAEVDPRMLTVGELSPAALRRSLLRWRARGWVARANRWRWRLTSQGAEEARARAQTNGVPR